MRSAIHLSILAIAIAGAIGAAHASPYQFQQRVNGLVPSVAVSLPPSTVAPAEPVAPSPIEPEVQAPTEPELPLVYTSCLDIKSKLPASTSGVHQITVGGNEIDVLCDMTSAGGGWTLVAAQFEEYPVINWNEGIQPDYDPSLASGRGFALSAGQIPAHTHTGFGKDGEATGLDYAAFTYSTGNIGVTRVKGVNTGLNYDIHRSDSRFFNAHHPGIPDMDGGSLPEWLNTLTFNMEGPAYSLTWAFSPMQDDKNARGYSFNGIAMESTPETFAWTVWVR